MTYNPDDLVAVRGHLLGTLDLLPGVARGVDLEPGEVGIAGDPAHASSGGYHEGNDDLSRVGLFTADYSKRESARDRPGTNAASALDIGDFDATVGGRRITLRSLSLALVDACRVGDPRTRDIREVIYTPDGLNVRRWDRLGVRAGGDDSHLWHTHISFHRDSEGRRHLDDNILGLLRQLIEGDDMAELHYSQHPAFPSVVRAIVEGATEDGYIDATGVKWDDAAARYNLKSLSGRLDALAAKVGQPAPVALDAAAEARIIDGVVAKLTPMLPTADQVADKIAQRLSNG